ncbi:hypothetical protein [Microcoleus vaginatus]|uniref:hypothetical protein n=1 Tax=Microcoleus vaginatus TaxID=119532 RepID=UPI001686E9AD|nr:hypothetical protein [Microcoleus sp. FACHB-84]MBD2008782.1 hypothetical protein [Microcoleus sp. FACHB-45]
MEPDKIINAFLQWLHENPTIFMPTAWQDLPELKTEMGELADDQLFPIAMAISKWCYRHQLGEELKIAAGKCKKEIDDAGEPTPTTIDPLTNITQTLRQSIEDSYKKLQKELDAENQSNTDND